MASLTQGHESEQALGDGEGQGGLARCHPWGLQESGTTEGPQQQLDQELPKQPTSEAGGAPGGRAPRGAWVGAQASQRHSELEGTEWLHWWVDHGVLQWRGWGVGRATEKGEKLEMGLHCCPWPLWPAPHPQPGTWQGPCKSCCSVAKLCLTLCDPMDCSKLGFPVLHSLPEFAQTHVH